MAFADPDFNISMWRVRDNPLAWQLYYPRSLVGREQGSIVADWTFESAAITTLEVTGIVYRDTMRFSVYPRAGRQPVPDEIGCELVTGVNWLLATTNAPPVSLGALASTYYTPFWMQITVSPDAADGITLRCSARLGTNAIATIESTAKLPQGTLGFSTSRGSVTGLVIYERSDAL